MKKFIGMMCLSLCLTPVRGMEWIKNGATGLVNTVVSCLESSEVKAVAVGLTVAGLAEALNNRDSYDVAMRSEENSDQAVLSEEENSDQSNDANTLFEEYRNQVTDEVTPLEEERETPAVRPDLEHSYNHLGSTPLIRAIKAYFLALGISRLIGRHAGRDSVETAPPSTEETNNQANQPESNNVPFNQTGELGTNSQEEAEPFHYVKYISKKILRRDEDKYEEAMNRAAEVNYNEASSDKSSSDDDDTPVGSTYSRLTASNCSTATGNYSSYSNEPATASYSSYRAGNYGSYSNEPATASYSSYRAGNYSSYSNEPATASYSSHRTNNDTYNSYSSGTDNTSYSYGTTNINTDNNNDNSYENWRSTMDDDTSNAYGGLGNPWDRDDSDE